MSIEHHLARRDRNATIQSQPPWIEEALAYPCERSFAAVEGVELETLSWGRRGDPGLLLIHGFAASADWWMFTAPFLARNRRVVALSFSGSGRSGWRDAYGVEQWTREAIGCIEACGLIEGGPVAIAAHSFGSSAGARAAAALGERARAFIILDRPIVQRYLRSPEPVAPKPSSRWASRTEAMARYRTLPPVTHAEPAVIAHVAQAAIHRPVDENCWTWRQDPDLRAKLVSGQISIADELAAMRCAKTFLRGAHSTLFPPEDAAEIRTAGMQLIEIPGADHHLMLEQPIATCVAIDLALAFTEWDKR